MVDAKIAIKPDTKKLLDKLKISPQEPYGSVIQRLADYAVRKQYGVK